MGPGFVRRVHWRGFVFIHCYYQNIIQIQVEFPRAKPCAQNCSLSPLKRAFSPITNKRKLVALNSKERTNYNKHMITVQHLIVDIMSLIFLFNDINLLIVSSEI